MRVIGNMKYHGLAKAQKAVYIQTFQLTQHWTKRNKRGRDLCTGHGHLHAFYYFINIFLSKLKKVDMYIKAV